MVNKLAYLNNFESEQHRTKKSQVRAIVSGQFIEIYDFETPYLYNLGKRQDSGASTHDDEQKDRATFSINRARHSVRRWIFANENAWGEIPKFITFTFAKNIADVKSANALWRIFSAKLRRRFGSLKYLAVIEFQKDTDFYGRKKENGGSVHYHVLFFDLPYTDNIKKIMADLWGNGFVQVKALQNVRRIGAYVSKYLTKQQLDKRLYGQKAYFVSKGLKRPEILYDQKSIDKELKRGIIENIADEIYISGRFGNIHYQQFKLKKHDRIKHKINAIKNRA